MFLAIFIFVAWSVLTYKAPIAKVVFFTRRFSITSVRRTRYTTDQIDCNVRYVLLVDAKGRRFISVFDVDNNKEISRYSESHECVAKEGEVLPIKFINTWFNGVGVDKIRKEFDTSKIYAYDESVYTYDDFVNNFIFGEHRLDGTEIVKEPKEFDGLGL